MWKLQKALYGLRASPLLWYKKLKEVLEELGLKEAFEDPCVFSNGKVIVFFFVDDIIIIFHERHRDK